ncbi:unnamed protein product [Mytilus coruscus]|uniref:Uncharacterized protein n=1 Tax=Mytilus coruscus TaxID=42192 RepID=A0A6J8A2V3_MYTCO|nr:unnamed protein product [Mytilus coruscus]
MIAYILYGSTHEFLHIPLTNIIERCSGFNSRIFLILGPTDQTSTVFLTENIESTTNNIKDYSNTTLIMALETVPPTNDISDFVTQNNFRKISTSFFDSEISNNTINFMSSENSLKYINSSEIIDIPTSHVSSTLFTSQEYRTDSSLLFTDSTTGLLMSKLFLSSFDSLAYFYISSSQTDYVYSRTFIETSFPSTSNMKSNTLNSIPNVLSEISSNFMILPTILLTGISDSIFKFYTTPIRTIDVKSFTNELFSSTFEMSDSIEERTSALIYHSRTNYLFTPDSSNSGFDQETESTNTETYWTNCQHLMSETVRKTTHINTSCEFSAQTPRTTQTILSTENVTPTTGRVDAVTSMEIYSSILQTHSPFPTALVSNKQPFSSESFKYLSITSFSDLTLKSSFFRSSINTFGMEDDRTITNIQTSLMTTSVYTSFPRTITESRISISGYLLTSFYPTEKDFSSRATEDFVTTTQSIISYLVSSTEQMPSPVSSNIKTADIMVFATPSSLYTIQNTEIHTIRNDSLIKTSVQLSDLGTAKVASKSKSDSSTSYPSFSMTTVVNSLLTVHSTLKNSNYSLPNNSDIPQVIVSASVSDISSSAFIPKTVHSTNNTNAGLSENTKNVIFITTVSVIAVFIITVSSIMLLTRVVLEKRNTAMKRETDTDSNDTQSITKIFPEFPYKEGSIYPRFSSPYSSTYMTNPYEQNWNKV